MKKIIFLLVLSGLFGLFYYLFVRSYEYEVRFNAKTTPGDVIATLRLWNKTLSGSEILKVDSFFSVKQKIQWNKNTYMFTWDLDYVNDDSTTKVQIKISQPEMSLQNKILIPFKNTPLESDVGEIGKIFYNLIKEHLRKTRVTIFEMPVEVPPSSCVCAPLKTPLNEKAQGMMNAFPVLSSIVPALNIKNAGVPQTRIKQWKQNENVVQFDFCFPILKNDNLSLPSGVYFKSFKPLPKALKAVYNGNYITSDRAWYELINFASRHNLKIVGHPIEFYYDNPNLGLNESEWKAEIYLPIE